MQLAGAIIAFVTLYLIAGPIGIPLLLKTDLKLIGAQHNFLFFISPNCYKKEIMGPLKISHFFGDENKPLRVCLSRITRTRPITVRECELLCSLALVTH